MPNDNQQAIEVLEKLIQEKEREVSRLRVLVARLQQASTDLASLRRTKDILSGKEPPVTSGLISVGAIDPPWNLAWPTKAISVTTQKDDLAKGIQTLSDRVEGLLREEGKPMHVDIITDRLRQQGLADLTKQTVTAVLVRETRKSHGRFVKTAANTFDLRKRENSS